MEPPPFDLERFLADVASVVDLDSGSRYPAGVAHVADRLEARIRQAGLEPRRLEPSQDCGPCLEVRSADVERFDALIVGHMDTVFPTGTAAERPFDVSDGHAHGPGVADMKSGVLLAINALERLRAAGRLGAVCLALNCDEEIGSIYSKPWIADLARRSAHAFVVEPARANGALVLERKGGETFTVELTGLAAHAGVEPEKGRSAIEELAHWILMLQGLNDLDAGTTVNVGVVQGGTVSNVVPASATGTVDARYWRPEEASRIHEAAAALAGHPTIDGVTSRIVPGNSRPPMVPTEATRKLCATIEGVGSEVSVAITWAKTGGGSDGNTTASVGTPTVDGMGPVGGNSHRPDEYVEVASIEGRLRLLEETLAAVAPPRH